MEVEFDDDDLDRLETDPAFDAGYPPGIVKSYRKTVQWVRAAATENDLYALRGLRFERLKGKRKHEYSMRLNKQYRLIAQIRRTGSEVIMIICSIEDYH